MYCIGKSAEVMIASSMCREASRRYESKQNVRGKIAMGMTALYAQERSSKVYDSVQERGARIYDSRQYVKEEWWRV